MSQEVLMREKFTFNIERDGKWFVGQCPEVPSANGQGRTLMSCTRNLAQAVALVLDEEDSPEQSSTAVDVSIDGQTRTYNVEMIESWEGFSVSCPELPGCHTQGDDEDEALDNIRDAIKDYVEVSEKMKHRKAQLTEVA
jgi:predicted RNase H-like HicB family nuclease